MTQEMAPVGGSLRYARIAAAQHEVVTACTNSSFWLRPLPVPPLPSSLVAAAAVAVSALVLIVVSSWSVALVSDS